MKTEILDILNLVTAKTKLERDRGIYQLNELFATLEGEEVFALETYFSELSLLAASWASHIESECVETSGWERLLGLINGSMTLINSGKSNPKFSETLVEPCMQLLTHKEVRVREGVGRLLGTISGSLGLSVYDQVCDRLLAMIKDNLERDYVQADDESGAGLSEAERNRLLIEKMSQASTERKRSHSASDIFHDTAGWKNLETSMKCLEHIVNKSSQTFGCKVDQTLTDLITETLFHTNRFVRETGYNLLGAIVLCVESEDVLLTHGETFAKHLSLGLSDNWSQVRLSASTATRNFLTTIVPEKRHQFFPLLLPCICLNRYYVAEGVKLYNQETWKLVINSLEVPGVVIVTTHIENFVNFYVAQTKADNHAVREAACACIAELGAKLPHNALKPHVGTLLAALIDCFRDDSWPVRDAACLACGNFIKSFPDESSSSLDDLYPLFFLNLSDNIPSVRQGAAAALANVVSAHPDKALPICLTKIEEGWKGVPSQEAKEEKNTSYEKGSGTYGVVKRVRDDGAVDHAHSNQVMYSCGSLAPKMGRGGTRSGGCMDHQFTRPSELWEVGDGCLHLAAELLLVSKDAASKVPALFPLLIVALKHRDYPQHVVLHETLCRRLPDIAKALGKQVFKRHLETFFPPLFYALDSDTALTSCAASKAVFDLAAFVGPGIFKGRVENFDPSLLNKLPPLPQTLSK